MRDVLKGKIIDTEMNIAKTLSLGSGFLSVGKITMAIKQYQMCLKLSQDANSRFQEGSALGKLAKAYDDLGETGKAIEFDERSIAIKREIGDRRGEENSLNRLGTYYHNLGDVHKAIEYYEQSLGLA